MLFDCSWSTILKFWLILTILFHFFSKASGGLTMQMQIQAHLGQIIDIQFSFDYSKFITISNDSKFIVWDTETFTILASKTVNSLIKGIGLNSATGQILALLGTGQIQIYEFPSLRLKTSYSYPNSGYGCQISFLQNGSAYIISGYDPGTPPKLHFYDKQHHYLKSIITTFQAESQVNIIFNVIDILIFVSSDQSTAPAVIQMYAYYEGDYVLSKRFADSNAQVKGMSISMDGVNFYSVADDFTLRNYTQSPFNKMYEVTSVKYYDTDLLAVNGLVPAVTYVSTKAEIIEYFRMGQISLETHYQTASPINQIVNLYPKLICTTLDGKVLLYNIKFFDGMDHSNTKWIVLSCLMGPILLILLVGLLVEIRYNKIKQKIYQKEKQNEFFKGKQLGSKYDLDQLP